MWCSVLRLDSSFHRMGSEGVRILAGVQLPCAHNGINCVASMCRLAPLKRINHSPRRAQQNQEGRTVHHEPQCQLRSLAPRDVLRPFSLSADVAVDPAATRRPYASCPLLPRSARTPTLHAYCVYAAAPSVDITGAICRGRVPAHDHRSPPTITAGSSCANAGKPPGYNWRTYCAAGDPSQAVG